MHEGIVYSRPVATAAALGSDAEDRHRFLGKRVLLTGDAPVLSTPNGRNCILASLAMVVRICRNVAVFVPPELSPLATECCQLAERIKHDQGIEFLNSMPNLEGYDAVLSVGTEARPSQPWTVINSNGWLARVSSGSTCLSPECSQENPVGALAAASLGVAEVFKRLVRIREARGRYLDGLTFSLYDYRVDTSDPGPTLPVDFQGDLLLVGAGAIGNGIVWVLSRLVLRGHVVIVDPQQFDWENLGTCIEIGPLDVGSPKAVVAEATLRRHGISAKGYGEDLARFGDRVGKDVFYPRVIINGLDNIEARHLAQNFWPDLIVDGAIGEFACQVSIHPWGRDVACLLCLFTEDIVQSSDEVASRATGLPVHRVHCAEEILTDDDVKVASAEKRAWLRGRLGRKICSVIEEAVAQDISVTKQREGFRPSAPFVACLSASMVVGELLKYWIGIRSPLEPRYQLDVLRGPRWGFDIAQERRRDCICSTRAHNIEVVRRTRLSP